MLHPIWQTCVDALVTMGPTLIMLKYLYLGNWNTSKCWDKSKLRDLNVNVYIQNECLNSHSNWYSQWKNSVYCKNSYLASDDLNISLGSTGCIEWVFVCNNRSLDLTELCTHKFKVLISNFNPTQVTNTFPLQRSNSDPPLILPVGSVVLHRRRSLLLFSKLGNHVTYIKD